MVVFCDAIQREEFICPLSKALNKGKVTKILKTSTLYAKKNRLGKLSN